MKYTSGQSGLTLGMTNRIKQYEYETQKTKRKNIQSLGLALQNNPKPKATSLSGDLLHEAIFCT